MLCNNATIPAEPELTFVPSSGMKSDPAEARITGIGTLCRITSLAVAGPRRQELHGVPMVVERRLFSSPMFLGGQVDGGSRKGGSSQQWPAQGKRTR